MSSTSSTSSGEGDGLGSSEGFTTCDVEPGSVCVVSLIRRSALDMAHCPQPRSDYRFVSRSSRTATGILPIRGWPT